MLIIRTEPSRTEMIGVPLNPTAHLSEITLMSTKIFPASYHSSESIIDFGLVYIIHWNVDLDIKHMLGY